MKSALSASGARIRGDDYQHLFAWLQAMRALQPGSGIISIGIEDPGAGSVDDVTVYWENGGREFFQAKSSVDGREVVSVEWLMKSSRAGGPSILQRFFSVWAGDPSSQQRPKLALVTNRPPAPEDPLIALRDGRDGTVARRLQEAGPKSKVGIARKKIAQHLGIEEEELLAFLGDASLRVGRLYDELREQAWPLMYATGLRHDEEALVRGLSIVRGWVTDGKRRISVDEIRTAVTPLERPGELPAASLVIQAIDRDLMPESAAVVLDWVDLFPGSEPRTRRRPCDDSLWNHKFRLELREAARKLRAQGQRRILVRGYMRLPTWFATGVEFGRTAGFEVVTFQNGVPWSTDGKVGDFPTRVSVNKEVSSRTELALGIGVPVDLSEDVLTFLKKSVPEVGRLICIVPETGPGNLAIRSDAEARAWALNTRDMVRRIVRDYRPPRLHLFLASPHGAVLLLGHLWDRMPPTQLYEDLGPLDGYCLSFTVPN